MEYVSVEVARVAPGLRLTLTGGMPAPWSEAAKGLFYARKMDYLAVLQRGGEANEDLVEWTGHRNAPCAIYNDEPVRVTALDMVNLAERIGSGPSLLPAAVDERVTMFGLLNEIAGEQGMAWNARQMMFAGMVKKFGEEAMAGNPMLRDYRYSAEDAAKAGERVIAILDALSARLRAQRDNGSDYFIGSELTALDIYWACFSQMLNPLPEDVNPMPDFLRKSWGALEKGLSAAGYQYDSILMSHRDYIFPKYLRWPLDF